MSLPNCGLDEAARYRDLLKTAKIPENIHGEAIVLDDCLVFCNWESSSVPLKAGIDFRQRIPLFKGINKIEQGKSEWSDDVNARSAGWLRSDWAVVIPGNANGFNLTTYVTAGPECAIINTGDITADFKIEKIRDKTCSSYILEPGKHVVFK